MIEYTTDRAITVDAFRDVLVRSTLGERRPVDDPACLARMVEHGNLVATAWDGDTLVGVARSVTDFGYCCYLSDLAVDRAYQKRGIGTELIDATRRALGPKCTLILLSAPAATGYYPKVGFTRHDSAWILPPGSELRTGSSTSREG